MTTSTRAKQKFNLSKLFKATFLAIFLMVEFFGFGVVPKAKAACSYLLQTSINKNTVTVTENNLVITAKIVSSGVQKDCDTQLQIFLGYVDKNNRVISLSSSFTPFQGNIAISTFKYDLNTLYPSIKNNLNDPSKIKFRLSVFSNNSINVPDGFIEVSITGASSQGDYDVRILPLQDSYKEGDKITVSVTTDPSKFSIDSSISKVYVNIYADQNFSNPLITDTVDTALIFRPNSTTNKQWGTTVSSSKGLTNGPHTISVDLWQANTQSQIGHNSSVSIQVSSSSNGPTAIADNLSPTLGSTVHLTIQNPPSGNWSAKIFVGTNTDALPWAGGVYSLNISTDKGFKDNSSNPVTVQIFDSSGNKVGENVISIKTGSAGSGTGNPTTPGTNPGQNNPSDKLYNPLPEEDLVHTFLLIAQGFLGILGIFAVVFIIAGGFQLVVAAGNEEAIIKGKKMITWAIIGLVVALLSFSIISIVENLLKVNIQSAPPLGIIQNLINIL